MHVEETVEDSTRFWYYTPQPAPDNPTIESVNRLSQSNHSFLSLLDRTRRQHLSDSIRSTQNANLEERMQRVHDLFQVSDEAQRAALLSAVDSQMAILEVENHRIQSVQDPPELRGKRTFGRGGKRMRTLAEVAERTLAQSDRIESSTNRVEVVDLVTPSSSPQRPIPSPVAFVGTTSLTGVVQRGIMTFPTHTSHSPTPSRRTLQSTNDSDIVVLAIQPAAEEQRSPSPEERSGRPSTSVRESHLTPTSHLKPKRLRRALERYEGELPISPRRVRQRIQR